MLHAEPKTDVRVVLSLGLLVALLIHAASMAFFQTAIPTFMERHAVQEPIPVGGLRFLSPRSGIGSSVNTAARDEMKQQVPYCAPCDAIRNPQPVRPSPTQPLALTVTTKPTAPKYSISVFVRSGDPLSQQLLNWFDNDLRSLKNGANYQVYTKDSPMYLSRYVGSIPVEAFPAMLFTDPTGGHVHAIDRSTIPNSSKQLWDDMKAARDLQLAIVSKVPSPPPTKESPTSASSSDSAASKDPCANGQCVLRALFHPGETAAMCLLIVVAVFSAVYFLKKR